jgi:hypothetical protein
VRHSNVKITGKRSDTETVMLRLEGGGWKSASNGNSLATYPTARTVPDGRGVTVMYTSTLPITRFQTPEIPLMRYQHALVANVLSLGTHAERDIKAEKS